MKPHFIGKYINYFGKIQGIPQLFSIRPKKELHPNRKVSNFTEKNDKDAYPQAYTAQIQAPFPRIWITVERSTPIFT